MPGNTYPSSRCLKGHGGNGSEGCEGDLESHRETQEVWHLGVVARTTHQTRAEEAGIEEGHLGIVNSKFDRGFKDCRRSGSISPFACQHVGDVGG